MTTVAVQEKARETDGAIVDGGWPSTKLGNLLCSIEAGTSVQSLERVARGDEWGVLKVSAVSWGEFKPRENKAIPPSYVPHAHEVVKRGDVLISRANTAELVGALVVVEEEPTRLMLSDKTLRLVLRQDLIDPAYLAFAVRTRAVRAFIEGNATGTSYSMRNISQETIRAIPIPLPTLPEQGRIAKRLTVQMAAVGRAHAAAQSRLAAAEALPAAYLREVFEDIAGAAPTRPLIEISEIASGVTLGKRPHARDGREVPYLRVANVQDGYLRLDSVYKIKATEDEIRELALQSGDLVLTEGGDRDKLGRGTWWNDELPECLHQNHIFRVRLHDGIVDHEFFGFQLRSAYAKDYFLAHAKQTTGIATINRGILDRLPVLIPAVDEQKRIAADLTRHLAQAARLAALARDELAAIDAMPAALLREAFQGNV